MSAAAADHLASVRQRMLQALIRRRAASWLLPLLPAIALAAALLAGAFGPADSASAARDGRAISLTVPLALAAAALLWAAADFALWRKRIDEQLPAWLNAAIPELEDSSTLLVAAAGTPLGDLQRKRLLARIDSALDDQRLRGIANQKARFNAIPLALAALAAASAWAYALAHTPQRMAPAGGTQATKAAIAKAGISLHAIPPAYTGAKPSDGAPRDLQVPQHSKLRWCAHGADATIELSDGHTLQAAQGGCAEMLASDSVFWRSRKDGAQRYTIRVTPDQAPQVAISAPNESVSVLKPDAQSAQIAVSVSDDYAIVKATLHMTLARGSGENIRFTDKESPLPASADPRKRSWSKQWMLKELGMEPGDELYFFVRASDNAPEPHIAQSPTYTLRLPGAQGESLESTALPSMVKPENLRSQRQIIIDTEQLVADMPRIGAAELRARSEKIAGDQAKLRLRYGQFLGEESSLFGEEEHSEGDGHEHGGAGGGGATQGPGGFGTGDIASQFGHAHDQEGNATIFDPATKEVLRRALAAMWDAEKQLRAIAPKPALPPEYKALGAIKELQQAERVYLHRTAFVPPAIKEEKRMSGDMAGAASYRRAQAAANELVPADVRELVQVLGGDGALPALWSKAAREAVARMADEEQRLAAQAAVQDVADGCQPCRAQLRAWLRATVSQPVVLLQARPQAQTRFGQALQGKGAP
ncbi:hypothetical protein GTP41_21945 [Pseudoduganella sp. DS3]|uniref:DUF4175 family protein n=1 Tax=Pseudoduganella guangdongensis TaxID=2692179 RepID=A0A6N9HMM4_9BURK|nr:DUF4175 family protein [Pseudoduganella guangdongensis]MYN04760.1 hypothetical protein [Pseudoduganella guangdongensis]